MAQKTNQSSPVPSEQNTSPRPCSNGCGFFGVPNTNGMCSVCFKEHQSRLRGAAGRVPSPLGGVGGGGGSVSSSEGVAVSKVVVGGGVEPAATLSQQMTEMSLAGLEDGKQLQQQQQQLAETLKTSTEEKTLSGSSSFAISSKDSSPSAPSSSSSISSVAVQPSVVATTSTGFAAVGAGDPSKEPPLAGGGGGGGGPPAKPKTNRCFVASCRKKVGLAGFDCRCGNQFCGRHRYSDQHDCPYDYKAEAAAKIRKENPAVVADKIRRI